MWEKLLALIEHEEKGKGFFARRVSQWARKKQLAKFERMLAESASNVAQTSGCVDADVCIGVARTGQ